MTVDLSAPHRLTGAHDLGGFDCGKRVLNKWLFEHAHANQKADYTQVMVVTHDVTVVGFYGLSMSSVSRNDVPRKIKSHPAPRQIPCLLLGQLAVDKRWRGNGIGRGLLKDALMRAVRLAGDVGTRAVVVNALDEEAARFWASVGFIVSSTEPQTFFRSMQDIRATLARALRD